MTTQDAATVDAWANRVYQRARDCWSGEFPITIDVARYIANDLLTLHAQAVAALEHDKIAYMAALGYPAPGDHNGFLTDGTLPVNGIAESYELGQAQVVDAAVREEREEVERVVVDLFKRWDKAISKGSGVSRKDVNFYETVLLSELRARGPQATEGT